MIIPSPLVLTRLSVRRRRALHRQERRMVLQGLLMAIFSAALIWLAVS